MKTLEIGVYQRVSGEGPEFLSRPLVNEKERLIFTGTTAADAEERARAWYQKNFEPQRVAPGRPKAKAPDEFEDLLG